MPSGRIKCFAMSDRRGSDIAEPILILRRLSRRLPLTLLASQVNLPDRLVHLQEAARQGSQVAGRGGRVINRRCETTTQHHHHVPIVPVLCRIQDARGGYRGLRGRLAILHGAEPMCGTHKHPLGKKQWGEMPLYPRGGENGGREGIAPLFLFSGGYSTMFRCRLSVEFGPLCEVCVSVAVVLCRFLCVGCICGR
nr:MAG TPA: hypothetical protein [Caudoviricetes sp.]DAX68942.1 MAG TPA: hypothetical protein [Caudoviricetes sp.]